jgi:hypothetical protein
MGRGRTNRQKQLESLTQPDSLTVGRAGVEAYLPGEPPPRTKSVFKRAKRGTPEGNLRSTARSWEALRGQFESLTEDAQFRGLSEHAHDALSTQILWPDGAALSDRFEVPPSPPTVSKLLAWLDRVLALLADWRFPALPADAVRAARAEITRISGDGPPSSQPAQPRENLVALLKSVLAEYRSYPLRGTLLHAGWGDDHLRQIEATGVMLERVLAVLVEVATISETVAVSPLQPST